MQVGGEEGGGGVHTIFASLATQTALSWKSQQKSLNHSCQNTLCATHLNTSDQFDLKMEKYLLPTLSPTFSFKGYN